MRRIAIALTALLMAGCADRPPQGPLPADLGGTHWIAKTVAGERVPEDMAVTLEFEGADRVYGRSGLNRYSGPIGVADGRLTIGPRATTRMACPPAQIAMAEKFLAALADARALRHDNSALVVETNTAGPETRLLPFTPP